MPSSVFPVSRIPDRQGLSAPQQGIPRLVLEQHTQCARSTAVGCLYRERHRIVGPHRTGQVQYFGTTLSTRSQPVCRRSSYTTEGIRSVVDSAVGDRDVKRIPLLLRQRFLRMAVVPRLQGDVLYPIAALLTVDSMYHFMVSTVSAFFCVRLCSWSQSGFNARNVSRV